MYIVKHPISNKLICIDFDSQELFFCKKSNILICLNVEKSSSKTGFIAKVYKNQKEIFSIPFPILSTNNRRVDLKYSWHWNVENGIKIVFGLENRVADDLWFEFNFLQQKYVNSGKAY